VIELRYGIYDKIDYRYIKAARQYRIGEILFDGVWHPVSQFIPDHDKFMSEREPLRKIGLKNYRRAQIRRGFNNSRQFVKRLLRWLLLRTGLYKRLMPTWRGHRL
jgi:hypothetical protein